jgi:predicted flavoprotein YhiN
VLPIRAAQAFAGAHASTAIANLPDRVLSDTARRLKRWEITPAGSEGWDKAEVTLGGVATTALSSKTMEARQVQGLFVIGEAVDVTGWLGGYNFQWAWSSGYAAGQAL